MAVPVDMLVAELKNLRRGRGMQAPAVDRQVGPALRQLCDIADADGAGVVREKIYTWVHRLIRPFPDDVQLVVTTALAINPMAQHVFHAERVAWLAQRADREARTMRRRIDDAFVRLAEAAVMPARPVPVTPRDPWHVKRFSALLRLDGVTPVCHELRTIVANVAGVGELPWSINDMIGPTDQPGDLDVEVLHGAMFARVQRPSTRNAVLRLQLPETLAAGQTHEFALEVRVPAGETMRPYYLFWPDRRCESFDLVVRFPPERLPRSVWRVCGITGPVPEDSPSDDDKLRPNGVGEVRTTFSELSSGSGFGIRWVL
jgi:hypothetical protein